MPCDDEFIRTSPLFANEIGADGLPGREQGAGQRMGAIGLVQWARETDDMPHMVFCSRFKQEMEGLDEPPFDSDFGHKVYNNVSKKAWGEWVERQKMLLNEYRLQPWTPQAQEFLVEQMEQFFFGEGAALPKEYVPPSH
jgi:Fe-S cluster biosynthesis and repair protein YggX